YTAPADLHFVERLSQVNLRVHLGLYQDETAELCHWHVPEAHFLEAWGDIRARDGTVSIIQPLIAALYGGKTAHDLVGILTEESERTSYEIVRGYWEGVLGVMAAAREAVGAFEPTLGAAPGGDFEAWWRRALHDGLIAGTALPARSAPLRDWTAAPGAQLRGSSESLEIVFHPDPTVFDGRFANNGWLQELPKPLTKLTWDNVALISPATAVRLGFAPQDRPELANEQVVALEYQCITVNAPLWVQPGQPDDCISVTLGYGRWRAGQVGTDVGFNAYRLRSAVAPWFDTGLAVRATGRRYPLSCTQKH